MEIEKVAGLAKGKLSCECGNTNWKEFLYVSNDGRTVAGCKHCGRIYVHDGAERGIWTLVGGPGKFDSNDFNR